MQHKMRIAKLSPKMAKRLGLSSNRHARVWCTCMDDPLYPPGSFGDPNDPRRLGTYDALGVVDMTNAGSAKRLWREHIKEGA